MTGSRLAFAEGRRKRREKGEIGPQRDRKARINQRLPFLAFFVVLLFFDAMVGSNSSWGQAPLMESMCTFRTLNMRLVFRAASRIVAPPKR